MPVFFVLFFTFCLAADFKMACNSFYVGVTAAANGQFRTIKDSHQTSNKNNLNFENSFLLQGDLRGDFKG